MYRGSTVRELVQSLLALRSQQQYTLWSSVDVDELVKELVALMQLVGKLVDELKEVKSWHDAL